MPFLDRFYIIFIGIIILDVLILCVIAHFAVSELLLYYTSYAKADLKFAIKDSSKSENEQKKENIINRDKEWLKSVETEDCFIRSSEGYKLYATLVKAPNAKRIALCIHGIQTYGIREYVSAARFFYDNGISSLIIDQRGYGQSEGTYVTYGDKESCDAKLWIDYLIMQFGEDIKIFVCGSSMGSATALLLNNFNLPTNVEYIVADCGYASVKEQLKHTMNSLKLPSDLAYSLYREACKRHHIYNPDKVDIIGAVKKSQIPILFIHGSNDIIVPTSNAYTLSVADEGKPCQLLITQGLEHAQSMILSEEALRLSIAFQPNIET